MALTTHSRELALLDDLDRPPLPLDFPDYRDLTVFDSSGQEIGRVTDMVFDMATRKPLLVIVLFGGMLGVGGKHILIPFNRLHDATDTHVHADYTLAEAESAPDVNSRNLKEFEPFVREWFPPEGEADASIGQAPTPTETHEGRGPLIRISRATASQAPAEAVDIRGQQVVDSDGRLLGVVDDWFYSAKLHRPEIVVVRRGGILGLFAQEAMVPYARLTPRDDGRLQAAVTLEELRYAPELGDDILDYGPYYTYWDAADSGNVIKPAPPDEPTSGPGTYVSPEVGAAV